MSLVRTQKIGKLIYLKVVGSKYTKEHKQDIQHQQSEIYLSSNQLHYLETVNLKHK